MILPAAQSSAACQLGQQLLGSEKRQTKESCSRRYTQYLGKELVFIPYGINTYDLSILVACSFRPYQ